MKIIASRCHVLFCFLYKMAKQQLFEDNFFVQRYYDQIGFIELCVVEYQSHSPSNYNEVMFQLGYSYDFTFCLPAYIIMYMYFALLCSFT